MIHAFPMLMLYMLQAPLGTLHFAFGRIGYAQALDRFLVLSSRPALSVWRYCKFAWDGEWVCFWYNALASAIEPRNDIPSLSIHY
jgi:hypothetical protein